MTATASGGVNNNQPLYLSVNPNVTWSTTKETEGLEKDGKATAPAEAMVSREKSKRRLKVARCDL